jgi:hypothetical protein
MESVSGAGLLKRSGFRKKCENENLENLSLGPGPSDRFYNHAPSFLHFLRILTPKTKKCRSAQLLTCIFPFSSTFTPHKKKIIGKLGEICGKFPLI